MYFLIASGKVQQIGRFMCRESLPVARNPGAAPLGIGVVLLGYPLHWKFSRMADTRLSLEVLSSK